MFERPGAAKVGQGFNFEVNPELILTFSFFALNAFWKGPRGPGDLFQMDLTVMLVDFELNLGSILIDFLLASSINPSTISP